MKKSTLISAILGVSMIWLTAAFAQKASDSDKTYQQTTTKQVGSMHGQRHQGLHRDNHKGKHGHLSGKNHHAKSSHHDKENVNKN